MFKWLRGSADGLADVQNQFLEMLADGRRIFDLAMSARVGGTDPDTIAADIATTEEATDEAERTIRRQILVHASVAVTADLSACLMYMSIAKDAERISDLSKNIFGIARTAGAALPGPRRDDLVELKDRVSPMIAEAARIFRDDQPEAAEAFIPAARAVQHHCRDQIEGFLRGDAGDPQQQVANALTYRQIGRICANLLNIVSSVVMPLDQLDYPTGGGGDDDGDES